MKTIIDPIVSAFRRAAGSALLSFKLAIPPKPKPAPRVARFGVYYPDYAPWQKQAGELLADVKSEVQDGPIALYIEAVVEKPKTTKRKYPRGDCDNYSKSTCDVITKAQKLWHDDDQIVLLMVSKRFTEPDEEAHVNINAWPMEDQT